MDVVNVEDVLEGVAEDAPADGDAVISTPAVAGAATARVIIGVELQYVAKTLTAELASAPS